MYRSTFLFLLLALAFAGCGTEQFGTIPQSTKSTANPVKHFEQLSCSNFTLIKPKVHILYAVDNSTSTTYLQSEIKNAIKQTVDSISTEFDYRVVGTPLLITSGGNNDYQVLTNSQDALSSQVAGHKIISPSEFNFFEHQVNGAEKGLDRIQNFVSSHISDGLFRKGAYLLVVLVSNGRDTDVEIDSGFGNGETSQNTSVYNSRKSGFLSVKSSLNSQQLRLFSVTARSACKSGWLSSLKSYVQMSKDLYLNSGAADQGSATYPDSYDLCSGGLSNVFTAVNNSIKQVVIPHTYRYWPITFAENNETVSLDDIKVYKVTNNSSQSLMSSGWTYYKNTSGSPVNTRILPTPGEPVNGVHFVKFDNGSEIVYPDCVMIKSVSRTEYFGYVVLPQAPKEDTVVLKINGKEIAHNSTDGWTYTGYQLNQNIKMPYPAPGDESPAMIKSGFMLKLNGSNNYYKSGDNVSVDYIPDGI